MPDRSWFVASGGEQQGPYSEAVFRDLIGKGSVTPDTLVWSEGMSDWQQAGDVPGLLSSVGGPPAVPGSGTPRPGSYALSDTPFAAAFGVWALLGRTLLLLIGYLLVIPAPWTATGFYRWFIAHVRVPQRANLAFTGEPGDIWYVFVILGLCSYAGFSGVPGLTYILIPVQAYLSWMMVRWIVANLSSEGRELPLSFTGSPWTYAGWYVLLLVSLITIVGWAWVTTAWMRWMCRNIAGTQREVLFMVGGWQVLWRTVVFALCMSLIIPIPWILRWYAGWYVSQFALGTSDIAREWLCSSDQPDAPG
jgi:GYF domain 2